MKPRVQIVGAGFSGMTLAYYLVQKKFPVTIYEKTDRCGGLIDTKILRYGIAETAANGILCTRQVEELFRQVGVPITPMKKESRKRFILRRGQLRQWPISFRSTITLGVFLFRFFFRRATLKPEPNQSVAAWTRKHLNQEILTYLISPALQGIYAGDVERLSAKLLLSRFFTPRMPRGQYRGTVSAKQGMNQLMMALKSYLQQSGVDFVFSHSALPEKGIIVLACGAKDASNLLQKHKPQVAQVLGKISLLPLHTFTAFFTRSKIQGFGVLFPRSEGVRSLGVLSNRYIFPERGSLESETWIYGGAGDPQPVTIEDVSRDRAKVFGDAIFSTEHFSQFWPNALPHYDLALENTLDELDVLLKNEREFFLTGNYLGSLGLASILSQNAALAQKIEAIHG